MSNLSFEQKLRNFTELLLREGVNLQPGQQLLINFDQSCCDMADAASEIAYEMGAKYVDLAYGSSRRDAAQISKARTNYRTFFPGYQAVRGDQLVDGRGAVLALRSQREPDLFAALDQTAIAAFMAAANDARKRMQEEGISGFGVNWCLACPPSPKWAQKVFPKLDEEAAVKSLWDQIFSMTFADQHDCLEKWRGHVQRLGRRAEILDSMGIRELHFTGNGTDLKVGLSERSQFLSGRKATPHGVEFCPNIPTFEAYTTPDWRRTEGVAVLTRPAIINGTKVTGLKITFEKGEVVDTQAETNVEAYRALIATDAGSRRLGEIALVGTDSPIYKSGLVFENTLYDENAACHFATGRAYLAALRDGDNMEPKELDACGYNNSKTHQDVMISNDSVDVTASLKNGERVPLIRKGAWEPRLLNP